MWKWTQINHLRLIILDCDSLNQAYIDFPYRQYLPDIEIVKINPQSQDQNIEIKYFMEDILKAMRCQSYETILISGDMTYLKEIMTVHIGTLLIGHIQQKDLKYMPDFVIDSIDLLADVLLGQNKGYSGEVFAFENKKGSLLSCQTEIVADDGKRYLTELYFGGRYYPEKHQYLLDDPLSFMILKFKHVYVDIMDTFFDEAIMEIRKKEKIDALTYIPPKPQDIEKKRFQRFLSLKLERNAQDGLMLKDLLLCQCDFSQKGNDLAERRQTVKGVFRVKGDVKGKNIILIDDVFSSGSTMLEAMKTLYEAGANKVIALAIAVSQMTESPLTYQKLVCSHCQEPMELVYYRKTHKLLFGCPHYSSHPDQKSIMSLRLGLFCLKKKNRLYYENYEYDEYGVPIIYS